MISKALLSNHCYRHRIYFAIPRIFMEPTVSQQSISQSITSLTNTQLKQSNNCLDLEDQARLLPSLPIPKRWKHLSFTTERSFSTNVPASKQTTVQVIPASQVHHHQHKFKPSQTVKKVSLPKPIRKAFYQKEPSPLELYLTGLPLIELPPHYSLICTKSKKDADETLSKMISEESVFGLDMEWRPTFRKYAPENKTGLIQICGASTILLIQVSQMNGLPDVLRKFLVDRSLYKAGVNIRGDGVKLYRDFNVLTDGLLDLRPISTLAMAQSPTEQQFTSKSLRALTGIFLGTNMPKGSVRLSNWNTAKLSEKQIDYAAKDAYASYALYHTMMGIAKIEKTKLSLYHLSTEPF
ncbi:ribonuclease H-like domain-containing protein [Halteromyces radiatus]|uniref:ribonuclease H-like domain-containing protein n=1 Tax=Halteromyces radiatus TaxID=101107 RepID=UPI00221F58AB|nr:ribonuclease H-like domain-containing protein [Halteromyces radiatus]KAI8088709.1 ribonuclease H-like domain-containing protein [Halteromyces radiatus]